MTHHHEDLDGVVERLQAERPTATALELDAIERRVRARSAKRPTRSRALILATLVLGMLFSTGGASLAISGLVDNDQAAVAQYPETTPPPVTPVPVPPAEQAPGQETQPTDESTPDDNQVLPDSDSAPSAGTEVQPERQVVAGVQASSSDGQLPFTGFAAIPVLLLGVALLTGGLVMQRTTRRQR